MHPGEPPPPGRSSDIVCIGAGLSAIALGARLRLRHPAVTIHFYERNSSIGGTWHVNTYPGCACDVPSALYSFAFAPNPSWSCMNPSQAEIKAYADQVASEYGIPGRATLGAEVVRCVWNEGRRRWRVIVRSVQGGEEWGHECRILFSAAGGLVYPNVPEIDGMQNFRGKMFHSAQWDHSVDISGKKVVVVGIGSSATQIVSAIVPQVASLTQIIRGAHWIVEAPRINYTPTLRWIFRNIPLANTLHRFFIFLGAEASFLLFGPGEAAQRRRDDRKVAAIRYLKKVAPEKYHDILIPDFEFGCKRRILDTGYLKSLHSPHLTLVKSPIISLTATGVQTPSAHHEADVIVFATGFKTNTSPLPVLGRGGALLSDHFAAFGGPGAYKTTAAHGFPNFFMLLGPNAATGHTSVLMASENTIEYAFRVLAPIFCGEAECAEVRAEAEIAWVGEVQKALRRMVWSSGCKPWYTTPSGWNGVTYPWSQAHFWWNSLFVIKGDWEITYKERREPPARGLLVMLVSLVWEFGAWFVAIIKP